MSFKSIIVHGWVHPVCNATASADEDPSLVIDVIVLETIEQSLLPATDGSKNVNAAVADPPGRMTS